MDVEAHLAAALAAWPSARGWCVAFSGGLDSTVLLHALVRIAPSSPLRAVHVDHGLQASSDRWAQHCAAICANWRVPLVVRRVQVASGASLERAARDARYATFAEELHQGEWLLTAQHRGDQAETLLFRLLRGAGARGLAAMPVDRPLGSGHLLRPFLDLPRAALETYAHRHGLVWIEDPSNGDVRFARNFLRQQVLPLLGQRWPAAERGLARAAAHLREAQALLDELAVQDLAAASTPGPWPWLCVPSLELAPLCELSEARQKNALRHWLASFTALPDSDRWTGWRELRDARPQATPCWRFGQGELQRAGGRLWWIGEAWSRAPHDDIAWLDPGRSLELPGNGRVSLESAPGSGLRVAYRRGGEVLTLPGRGRRDLKRLLNERAVPPFLRVRLPLLWRGGELLAVANLPGLDATPGACCGFSWQPPAGDPV